MKVPYDVVLPQLNVLGSTMAYRERGTPEAPVALFLHGNPTSSHVWRNVLPLVAPVAHCIAPDLIGLESSAFVIAQDWGTALAFHLAARRPEFIRALAFMEFIRSLPTWDDFYPGAIETFQKFRTQQKFDGWRHAVQKAGTKYSGINKLGQFVAIDSRLAESLDLVQAKSPAVRALRCKNETA